MNLQVVVNFRGDLRVRRLDHRRQTRAVDRPSGKQPPEPTMLGGLDNFWRPDPERRRPRYRDAPDRETSGLVRVSKNTRAARELGWIFSGGRQRKSPLTHSRLGRDVTERRSRSSAPVSWSSAIWVRQVVHPAGRDCRTRFQVEQRFERDGGRFSLIRSFPETGADAPDPRA